MRYRPTFEEYAELARHATLVPVYRQLIGDTLTPVSAFCKIQEGDWSFLFESVVGGERLGRYSFLGAGPFLHFQAFERRIQIDIADAAHATAGGARREEFTAADPLAVLEERLARYHAPTIASCRICVSRSTIAW